MNRLNIIGELIKSSKGRTRIYYKCKCICGNIINVDKYKYNNGHTKSCGCLKSELLKNRNTKHGKSNDRLYHLLHELKSRCYNKSNKDYQYYGGLGVKIYKEWLNDVTLFIKWCNDTGYKKGLTIDRINPNGNYEPNNCQWITIQKQQEKRRDTNKIIIGGIVYTLKEIANTYNIKLSSVRRNYYRKSINEFIDWVTSYSK